jgi:dimethylargininase
LSQLTRARLSAREYTDRHLRVTTGRNPDGVAERSFGSTWLAGGTVTTIDEEIAEHAEIAKSPANAPLPRLSLHSLRPLRSLVLPSMTGAGGTITGAMPIALTRAVPPSIDRCELTHLAREPIDHARASAEHAACEAALGRAGCRVERLPPLPDHPDSVFVEDTAIVFDEIAVIARPGAESRRGEVESTARALAAWRRLARIEAPATLDGGDVLVTPRAVYVGISGRTNPDGARQLAAMLEPFGIGVAAMPVSGCLHLKSAVTWLGAPRAGGRDALIVNPAWVDIAPFDGVEMIAIDPEEPWAANVLAVNGRIICAETHPRTRRRLEARGYSTVGVPAAELAKAEGGVTCCSIIFSAAASAACW